MAEQNDIINNSRTMPNKATAKATKKKTRDTVTTEPVWSFQGNQCAAIGVCDAADEICERRAL